MTTQLQEEVFELNGKRFYKTNYFDIACVRCENGYYNFTKIAQDNGYASIARITRNRYWIDYIEHFKENFTINILTNEIVFKSYQRPNLVSGEFIEITNDNLSFTIVNQEAERSCLNGVYYPKLLLHFFCEHVNKLYAMKIMNLIRLIEEEIKLRNITLEEKINEQVKLVNSLKTDISNCNSAFNHSIPGSIRIRIDNDSIKLRFSQLATQLIEENDELITNVYNVKEIERLLNYYSRNSLLEDIEFIRMNTFRCSVDNLKQTIEKISKFELEISYNKERAIYDASHVFELSIPYDKMIAKSFEFYCALKYGFIPSSQAPIEAFGLNKKDIGCDIIDLTNKRIGQCKYYQSKLKMKSLNSFLEYIYATPQFEAYLFINDNCELEASIEETLQWQVVKVSTKDFISFINEVHPIETTEEESMDAEELIKMIVADSQMKPIDILKEFNKRTRNDLTLQQFKAKYKTLFKRWYMKQYTNASGYMELEMTDERKQRFKNWIIDYIPKHIFYKDFCMTSDFITAFNKEFKRHESQVSINKLLQELEIMFERLNSHTEMFSQRDLLRLKTESRQDEMIDYIISNLKGQYMNRDEFIKQFNSYFNVVYTKHMFTKEFGALFERNKNGDLRNLHHDESTRERVLSLKRNIEEEKEFIRDFLKDGPHLRIELLKSFNEYFESDYTEHTFTLRFGPMFVHIHEDKVSKRLPYTVMNGTRFTICELRDSDNKQEEFIKDTLKGKFMTYEEFMPLFETRFHFTYSALNFNQKFGYLFEHKKSGQLKQHKRNGKTFYGYILKRDLKEEEQFITEILKDRRIKVGELIDLFNEAYATEYNAKYFGQRFSSILKPEAHKINGIEERFYVLRDE